MRNALVAASLALVAGTALGCGGGAAEAPDDASKEEFCGAVRDFYAEASELDEDDDLAVQVEVLKDFAEELEEIGTPEDMPEDARAGFELDLEAIRDLPDDPTEEDLESFQDDYSVQERRQSDAFSDYVEETCETG